LGIIRRKLDQAIRAAHDLSNQTGFANRSRPPFSAKSSGDQSNCAARFVVIDAKSRRNGP
jgi:hypothetical protein